MNTTTKALRALGHPRRALQRVDTILLEQLATMQHASLDLLRSKYSQCDTGLPEFNEILEHSRTRTDISDHLPMLFLESLPIQPKLIVELGVRRGESTFVLERVASLYGSKLLSVDLDDCSRVSGYHDWSFIKSDDITLAKRFPQWCQEHHVRPSIDVLFIDTSHEFAHTLQEMYCWLPFTSRRCKVFFHDTNMKRVFFRRDGSMGLGWNNGRGVIAAIEKYFDRQFQEQDDFTTVAGDWIIRHHACSSGMTILEKWRVSSDMDSPPAAR